MDLEFNHEIDEILKECGVVKENAYPVLLCYYFNQKIPSYIPPLLLQKIHATGIVTMDVNHTIHWKVPLFAHQETAFDWVKTEYCELFKQIGKPGRVKESTSRLKKLFAKHPDIRKEDIIGAAQMYINNVENPKYCRDPHYFILKGIGANKTEDILEWIEKFRLSQEMSVGRISKSITIQN